LSASLALFAVSALDMVDEAEAALPAVLIRRQVNAHDVACSNAVDEHLDFLLRAVVREIAHVQCAVGSPRACATGTTRTAWAAGTHAERTRPGAVPALGGPPTPMPMPMPTPSRRGGSAWNGRTEIDLPACIDPSRAIARGLRLGRGGECHESEAPRPAGRTILGQADVDDCAAGRFEELLEYVL